MYDSIRLSDGFAATALVSHAYSHVLLVDRTSGLLYIAQSGGLANSETLFGPFTADEGCEGLSGQGLIGLTLQQEPIR